MQDAPHEAARGLEIGFGELQTQKGGEGPHGISRRVSSTPPRFHHLTVIPEHPGPNYRNTVFNHSSQRHQKRTNLCSDSGLGGRFRNTNQTAIARDRPQSSHGIFGICTASARTSRSTGGTEPAKTAKTTKAESRKEPTEVPQRRIAGFVVIRRTVQTAKHAPDVIPQRRGVRTSRGRVSLDQFSDLGCHMRDAQHSRSDGFDDNNMAPGDKRIDAPFLGEGGNIDRNNHDVSVERCWIRT